MKTIRSGSASIALLLSASFLSGCVQGETSSLSALVPPEALSEETAKPSQTVDTPRELAAAEKAVEAPAESEVEATTEGATAFAAAETAPKPNAAPKAQPAERSKGVFAAWLKTNENARKRAAENREEAQQRVARLRQQSLARSKRKAQAAKEERTERRPRKARALRGEDLPGVRLSSLFGIDGSDTSTVRERAGSRGTKKKRPPVVLASVASRARGPGGGLLRQHAKVSVNCLKPGLVEVIRRAERHFGRRAVVTSGYRSPRHNRRVRGARKSLHMSCAAADIQIKGVSKWTLAKYLRTVPGRGGVGTYCHTQSVHIDVGGKRDWNWRCRRSKRKRRRS